MMYYQFLALQSLCSTLQAGNRRQYSYMLLPLLACPVLTSLLTGSTTSSMLAARAKVGVGIYFQRPPNSDAGVRFRRCQCAIWCRRCQCLCVFVSVRLCSRLCLNVCLSLCLS